MVVEEPGALTETPAVDVAAADAVVDTSVEIAERPDDEAATEAPDEIEPNA